MSSIKTSRLLVYDSMFNIKPVQAIKSLLGSNVKIIKYAKSDVIRDDHLCIVDVEYQSIELNPLKIYFVPISDVKPIAPSSTEHGTRIGGCNVIINMQGVDKSAYKKYYPIRVIRMDRVEEKNYYQYYGMIVKSPLNSICTPLLLKDIIEIPTIEKLYPGDFDPKETISNDDMALHYSFALKKFPLLSSVKGIQHVKSFDECVNKFTGYIIDWNLLKNEQRLHGIVLTQPNRKVFSVLYVPTDMFVITRDEIENITKLLEFDRENYLNFMYSTS